MAQSLLHSIIFVAVMLAVGLALRTTVRWLKMLYLPASVIAGLIGFGVIQLCTSVPAAAPAFQPIAAELATWPGWLIAVVFAALLLERSSGKSFGEAIRRGARSAILAWIIILGQITIGLIVYLLLVRPVNSSITPAFAQLLEVSWAGGHGSSAAMADVFRGLGFPEGRDLAFFLATVGLIWGVISGLILVNLAIRRRWTENKGSKTLSANGPGPFSSGSVPAAYAKTRSEVIDTFSLQVVILTAAFAIGYGLQRAFIAAGGALLDGKSGGYLANVPLFLFTLMGGLAVRQGMRLFRIDGLIDSLSIQRLLGVAIDFLIVAAISTMRIESLQTFIVPMVALILLAAAWSAFCLIVLARKLLPPAYWFELGLLNYGFSTANTPQGIMLLRIVDPDLQSGAAEDYAVAAPLSAPFIGGGIVTIVVMPLILQSVATWLVLICLVLAIVALYLLGIKLARHR